MKMKKVTVIIPIYNAESFLRKCLNSLLNQDYSNVEVLMIDDGSTDNSRIICEEYASRSNKFRLYSQKNSGVSSARNHGLEMSTGDYIMFVDSDDYLEANTISYCMELVQRYNIEILKFNYYIEYKKLRRKHKFHFIVDRSIEQEVFNTKIFPKILDYNDLCNVWNAIFKKSVIGENKFDNNITLGEDYLFLCKCIKNSKNLYFLNKYFYHYNVLNAQSITHDFSFVKGKKKLYDSIVVSQKIGEMYNIKKEKVNRKMEENFVHNLESAYANLNYKNTIEYLKYIQRDILIKKLIKNVTSSALIEMIMGSRKKYITLKLKMNIKKIIKKIL